MRRNSWKSSHDTRFGSAVTNRVSRRLDAVASQDAGTADCVGTYGDVPSLIDFKTARRVKKREWIEDYFLQGCAYANAHNVMFNTEIRQIVILMVDRDLMFKEFIVKSDEFSFLTEKWKKRLITFKNKYSDIRG